MSILVLRDVSISNDLFGSDVMSSFWIANGYTKPLLQSSTPEMLSEDLIIYRGTLLAKKNST